MKICRGPRTFGNATTLPSKEEAILPTIEEETAEEIYAILLDDSENYAPCLEEGDVDLAALVLKFDLMIGVEVILPSGEEKSALCKVLRRSVDEEGTPMGCARKVEDSI
eukprot:scaffold13100_cov84-Skeletonema_dohrnii-CCMP3373.AAC.2